MKLLSKYLTWVGQGNNLSPTDAFLLGALIGSTMLLVAIVIVTA